MNYINYKKEFILWIILLIPSVYLACIWNSLPEKVPMHFGINGEINRWGSKLEEFELPVIALVTYLLTLFLPLIDPKKMNYEFFQGNFFKIRLIIFLFLGLINVVVIHAGVIGKAPNEHMIMSSVFLFLALLGNFMINIKPNWFIGIRTPWTLSSEVVWKKTHLIGGRLFFYGGLFCFVLSFLLPVSFFEFLFLTYVLALVAFLVGYSFCSFKQEEKSKGDQAASQAK